MRKSSVHPFAEKQATSSQTRRVGAAVNQGSAGSERLPSPWGEHGWKVFLFDLDEIEHAVQYVRDNPTEAGLQGQTWPWVKEFGE